MTSDSSEQHRPKLLFYCQHLLGLGHVSRSVAMCLELQKSFDVIYVQGGPPSSKIHSRLPFRVHQLEPLLMTEETNELYDPNGMKSVASIFTSRQEQLNTLISSSTYDLAIIELFPFGRKKFQTEILNLIESLRSKNSDLKVISSVRDILVQKADSQKRDAKVADLINTYFDAVLVHTDPNYVRFEDSFSAIQRIQKPIYETGFVAESTKSHSRIKSQTTHQRSGVLVSQGGGAVGFELLAAVAKAATLTPEISYTFVTGPFCAEEYVNWLHEICTQNNRHMKFTPFLEDFEAQLTRAQLSVSLGGYNTVMNLLNTQTYGLIYPFDANEEQRRRAQKFAQHGCLEIIPDTLIPKSFKNSSPSEVLAELIRDRVHSTRVPNAPIQLDGAQQSRSICLLINRENDARLEQ